LSNENLNDQTKTFVPLRQGTEVGPYRLIRELGAGGMGEVFLAEDSRLDRLVALKFLTTQLAEKDEFRHRFMREAKSAGKLSHNNIVIVYDVGEAIERLYIAMEYIEGQFLRQLIDTQVLSYDESISIFDQICQGLKIAHRSEIIHRDLKPSNIMITDDKQVKILDFGLAKGIVDGFTTNTGTALGTANYMAGSTRRVSQLGGRKHRPSVQRLATNEGYCEHQKSNTD